VKNLVSSWDDFGRDAKRGEDLRQQEAEPADQAAEVVANGREDSILHSRLSRKREITAA
jgi:hypothetical protein